MFRVRWEGWKLYFYYSKSPCFSKHLDLVLRNNIYIFFMWGENLFCSEFEENVKGNSEAACGAT